jgi:DNA-binding NarL/FixJ family response regulator
MALDRIRVLVLHEDPVVLAGLRVAFANYADLEIQRNAMRSCDESGLAHGGESLQADVVVADYAQGLRLVQDIHDCVPEHGTPKVVIVGGIDREWEICYALDAGVRGYLLVGCSWDELVDGVRAVQRGDRYLSPQVAARLAESVSLEPLTAREEQVLRLVVDGLSNKGIARQLDIAVGTVKSHMKSIFSKLNVESRTRAVAVVERRGLLRSMREVPTLTADFGNVSTAGWAQAAEALPISIVA